ncbi:hypothetical protein BD770DRAFT_78411 [Pilaira anomala]|nr:hypothetical protein BD770DRAFT_78411 [Pilaira anomala]
MEQPLSYNQQPPPNRIIISLALVQSELFWLCSAFFCIFQESGLLKKPTTIKPINHSRARSHSEPLQQLLSEETMKTKKDRKVQAHRRLSLPTTTETSEDVNAAAAVEIRKRPTTQDELTGTTCPPIWWQKTRIMLGHAPVHGDSKPRSIKQPVPVPSSSSSIHLTTQIETNSSSHQRMSASTSSSSSSVSSVATNDNSKSTYTLSPVASATSALSSQSAPSISSSTKRHSATKKLVSKLNSAFRLRKS